MQKKEKLTKEEVFNYLFNSYDYGNLGLFIGAGFSKAVVNSELGKGALSWGDLIKQVCIELDTEIPEASLTQGMSYPDIASQICEKISKLKKISYDEAKKLFKRSVCNLTNWLPDQDKRETYSELLKNISPSWIITTNYDLVIERLLTGLSVALSPNDFLISSKEVIPVYHLHGVRHDPESIIITQEDYVQLFRPNEYRQIKLALTIKESTSLILGYGLGDVNVLSAVDWSKNIFKESKEYPHQIIQAIRTDSPSVDPYFDKNENIIIEIADIQDFLLELTEAFERKSKEKTKKIELLDKLIGELKENREARVNDFIKDEKLRLRLLVVLSNFENYMVTPYIDFLSACIEKTWISTIPDGAFGGYDQNLRILLDIIINYDCKKIPPALLELVADSLDRVFKYVGDSRRKYYGISWDATDTWHGSKNKIPKDMVYELYHFSKRRYPNLNRKFEQLLEMIESKEKENLVE
ncbi:MAG: SIR2 family NAD-dependent protein deacylase [Bacillota bacterium]